MCRHVELARLWVWKVLLDCKETKDLITNGQFHGQLVPAENTSLWPQKASFEGRWSSCCLFIYQCKVTLHEFPVWPVKLFVWKEFRFWFGNLWCRRWDPDDRWAMINSRSFRNESFRFEMTVTSCHEMVHIWWRSRSWPSGTCMLSAAMRITLTMSSLTTVHVHTG